MKYPYGDRFPHCEVYGWMYYTGTHRGGYHPHDTRHEMGFRSTWDRQRSDSAALVYSTITQSLLPRPKTSGEYISSALAGGTMNVPGVVARATYVYW